MPASDGTGPMGQGPMSGRGLGLCMLEITPGEPGIVNGYTGLFGRPVHMAVQHNERTVSQMPGGDRTGPMGMGPMTGRAAGFCAGYPVAGAMNPIAGRPFGVGRGRGLGFGRGMGMGFRGGRGWCGYPGALYPASGNPYGAPYGGPPTPQQEVDMLKGQAASCEETLKGIQQRIAELDSTTEAKEQP